MGKGLYRACYAQVSLAESIANIERFNENSTVIYCSEMVLETTVVQYIWISLLNVIRVAAATFRSS